MPSRQSSGNRRQRHRSQFSRKIANAGQKARRGGNGSRDDAASILKNKTEKKTRTSTSINEKNRKTEICRNWEKGICVFGGGCAFAHGHDEIKRKTLRNMEEDGRIPDASKHHAFPCMSWVATGACSYGPGCRFIHDRRVQGPAKALPRTSYGTKIGNNGGTAGPARAVSLLGFASDDNDSRFFFPDIKKDPESIELPPDEVRYDINATQQFSTAYRLWYSFVSVCVELSSALTGDPEDVKASADTIESNGRRDSALGSDLPASATTDDAVTPVMMITGVTHRSGAAATSSPGPTAAAGSSAHGYDAVGTVDAQGEAVDSVASSASAVRGSPQPRDGGRRFSSPSSSVIENDHSSRGVARRFEGDNTDDDDDHGGGTEDVTDDTLKPLPVFEDLRSGASARLGKSPTRRLALASLHEKSRSISPGSTPATSCSRFNSSRTTTVALGLPKAALEVDTRHDIDNDDGVGDDDDAYASRSWSSCSSSSSSCLSSPSSDSYVSCGLLTSPSCSWRSAVQSPIAGRDTPWPASSDSSHDALPAPLHGGCEGTVISHADAGSWSSSASISVEEQGCRCDGSDSFSQPELGLPSPSKAAARAVRPFGGGAASRLPVFASLYSDANDSPISRGGDPRGCGGVLDLRLSGGRCGGGAGVGAAGSSVKEMRSMDSGSCGHIAGFFDDGAGGSIWSGGVTDSSVAVTPAERVPDFRFLTVHRFCPL